MQSHQLHETKMQKICRLARAGDKAGLKELVASGVCIGVYENRYNAVMWLAKEGHVDAMWFLINNFGASVNLAVLGAAWGGHEALVWQLIEEGAGKERALEGAGLAGNLTLAKRLIKQRADTLYAMKGAAKRNNEDWQELVNQLMVYVRHIEQQSIDQSNVLNYVERLRELMPQLEEVDETGLSKWEKIKKILSNDPNWNTPDVIEAAVYGGHDELVIYFIENGIGTNGMAAEIATRHGNMLLVERLKQRSESSLDTDIMRGAAQAGNFALVKDYFNNGAKDNYAKSALNYVETNQLFMNIIHPEELKYIVMGTAESGKVEYTQQLIAAGATKRLAYQSAVVGGQMQLVKLLDEGKGVPIDRSVTLAAMLGNLALNNEFLADRPKRNFALAGAVLGEQIEVINQLVTDEASITYVFNSLGISMSSKNEAYALRLMTFVDNEELRRQLAHDFYSKKNTSSSIDNIENMAIGAFINKKVNKLRFLMKQHDFDYNQAQAWLTPQLHIMFLQVFPALKDQLPLEILLSIASFVTNGAHLATSEMTINNALTLFTQHQKMLPSLCRAVAKQDDDAAVTRFTKITKF